MSILVRPLICVCFLLVACTSGPSPTNRAVNQASAIGSLKIIHGAQVVFQSGAFNDEDGDRLGEHGSLAQLAGQADCLGTWRKDDSGAFVQIGTTTKAGQLDLLEPIVLAGHGGYRFQVYLPEANGFGDRLSVREHPAAVDLRERYFIAYAWPEQPGISGERIYCLTQTGHVLESPSGLDISAWNATTPPPWWLAFAASEPGADFDVKSLRSPLWAARQR